MEAGGSSSNGAGKGIDKAGENVTATATMSPLSKETLSKLKKKISRRSYKTSVRYIFHDTNSPGYEWLLPGWLAEERHMPSGRIYRYYYDPSAYMYKTRQEVLSSWDEAGVIMIDSDDEKDKR